MLLIIDTLKGICFQDLFNGDRVRLGPVGDVGDRSPGLVAPGGETGTAADDVLRGRRAVVSAAVWFTPLLINPDVVAGLRRAAWPLR
jgi:hypothetical protein